MMQELFCRAGGDAQHISEIYHIWFYSEHPVSPAVGLSLDNDDISAAGWRYRMFTLKP